MLQTPLPIDRHIAEIAAHVRAHRTAVIVAPPGSGKTTRVPPALAAIGRTIVLQPRRVAARALARRIASERGWTIGREIGWHIRFERRFASDTQLVVATEGILTARLQSDPLLSDFSVVVLDEFHERSIHADLALALAREASRARDDLALVVMSATLDAAPVAAYLDGARVFEIGATPYPVETRYRPGATLTSAVREAIRDARGDILCFLPGAREIERERTALRDLDALVLPLHGSLDVDEQERALAPASRRKVILATNIAETSLTVEGVTDVIDSGLHKVLRFDTATAVDHLVLERIPRDSADQRAGRAGRTGPGRATLLWDERDRLRPHREAEVRRVDLASALLEIVAWGGDPLTFPWFERPPGERIGAGMELLSMLGAIDARRKLTPLGGQIRRFPLHPRLARMIVGARGDDRALALAAELSEAGAPEREAGELRAIAKRIIDVESVDEETFLRAILAAWPDRVAKRREPKSERVLLSSGTGAVLAKQPGVADADHLVALDISGSGSGEPLVRRASPIERDWLTPTHREKVHMLTGGRVRAVDRVFYGAILLREEHARAEPGEAERLIAAELAPDPQLRNRAAFAGAEVDWETIARAAASGQTRVPDVSLASFLPYDVRRRMDAEAPERIALPSGRTARLDYRHDGSVFAAVKLQELFGLAETPRLGSDSVPVTFELLAPNGRPVQTTRDLRSFWTNTYPEVRKELRARYPKHPWPEDPWSAKATHRTKGR